MAAVGGASRVYTWSIVLTQVCTRNALIQRVASCPFQEIIVSYNYSYYV